MYGGTGGEDDDEGARGGGGAGTSGGSAAGGAAPALQVGFQMPFYRMLYAVTPSGSAPSCVAQITMIVSLCVQTKAGEGCRPSSMAALMKATPQVGWARRLEDRFADRGQAISNLLPHLHLAPRFAHTTGTTATTATTPLLLQAVPFSRRVDLLRALLAEDKARGRWDRAPHAGGMQPIKVQWGEARGVGQGGMWAADDRGTVESSWGAGTPRAGLAYHVAGRNAQARRRSGARSRRLAALIHECETTCVCTAHRCAMALRGLLMAGPCGRRLPSGVPA